MNSDEVIEFEDRSYVNPQTSIDEQNQFIEKFRALQDQNQAQINQQTQALGSQVPSNQGGLVGAENLWNVQYQRPQVNAAIENLRANNQLQALNTVMSNQQNAMANRLNQAKRAYYRAQHEAAKRNRTSRGTNPSTTSGNIITEEIPAGVATDTTVRTNAPGTSVVLDPLSVAGDNINRNPIFDVINTANNEVLKKYDTPGSPSSGSSTSAPTSFWELNNPLAWIMGIGSIFGSEQKVKQ